MSGIIPKWANDLAGRVIGMFPRGDTEWIDREMLRGALAAALVSERDRGWQDGYLTGFQASGEGWNGEYPFEGVDPRSNAHWVATRERNRSEA